MAAINWDAKVEQEGSVRALAGAIGITESVAYKLVAPERYGFWGKIFDVREDAADLVAKYLSTSPAKVREHYLDIWRAVA